MFLMLMGIGYFVHGFVLAPDYAALPSVFRSTAEQPKYLPFMLLAHLLTAIAFVWIYVRGRENKPFLGQGIRYGLVIAALTVIPKFLVYYSVQPMPAVVVAKQIVLDTIGLVLMGVVVARLNK